MDIKDIPPGQKLKRIKGNTKKAKVVILDNKRKWHAGLALCINCVKSWILYFPEIDSPSAHVRCDRCKRNNIVLIYGVDKDTLYELGLEYSGNDKR